jgi:hypothetical protein
MRRAKPTEVKFDPTHVLACFLTLAHRFFAALAIAALPAADKVRFFTQIRFRSLEQYLLALILCVK